MEGLNVINDIEKILSSNQQIPKISYSSLLKCCIKSNDFEKGKQIHDMIRDVIKQDIFTQTTLIHLYGHFGDMENAEMIFNTLPTDSLTPVTIAAMMKILSDNGCDDKALNLYDRFRNKTDDVVDLLAIKACTNLKDYGKGYEIIRSLSNTSNTSNTNALLNTMIDFYGACGDINNAIKIFESISITKRQIDTTNAMIKAYANNNMNDDALKLFDKITKPDDISILLAIKACTNLRDWEKGKEIHYNLNLPIKYVISKYID